MKEITHLRDETRRDALKMEDEKVHRVLALSTGSTSTKLAVYEGETALLSLTLRHSSEELASFPSVLDQYLMRKDAIIKALGANKISVTSLSAVASVGGPIKPLPGGVWRVNEKLADDIRTGNVYMQHASHLGALISREIEREYKVPAFIVDPVTTDEFTPIARVSGLKEVPRTSQAHALNAKAVARRVCREIGKPFESACCVVAHMGGGSSVSALRNGRIVDALTSRQDGPFSAEAAGGIPMPDFVDYIETTGFDRKKLKAFWFGAGGLVSHLGTNSIEEAFKRADSGDDHARMVLEAMAYGTSKAIGSMAAALGRAPDAIVLTGGAAHSTRIVQWIKERVSFIAPVFVVPGEDEMPALADAALRVLSGEEEAKEYE